ncbi:glycosyltransferase [Hwanghaeella sp.]|uniref:glycosyltransferase n=1 Tax=Hwanghaeella sp. TaxID=2605943 RepID=UPI003CCC2231
MSDTYVLVSPCRNESTFMRKTLDSVIAQTIPPTHWVIVDDGSTDETPEILREYADKHDWITVVTRADRGRRAVGPGVIDAFYSGLETVDLSEFDFLCKLDLDLDLPPRYFEILLRRMANNPRLGTCSGKPYIYKGDQLVSERKGDDMSVGMTKFYRTACFQEIGGFVREVMWDGIDCHRCRMHGWAAVSWDEPAIRFVHLRPMGTSQKGVMTGRMRHGYGQYFMGTGFFYMAASCIFRLGEKPYVTGALATLWGWLRSAIKNLPRYDDPEFRKFVRAYHRRVLVAGKQKAIEEIHAAKGIPQLDLS